MDLESELRAAMASHVSGVEASSSLVSSVRQRHRRRRTRIRAGVSALAVVVAASALWPTYHGIRATPASNKGTMTPPAAPSTAAPVLPGSPRIPSGHPASPTPGRTPSSATVGPHQTALPAPGASSLPGVSWVSYVPAWLQQVGSCTKTQFGGLPTTRCRWTGGGDWLVVQVVKAPTLLRPEQLGVPGFPSTTVHRQRAISTSGRLAWIERPGVGVLITSDPSLDPQLPKIADGIHP